MKSKIKLYLLLFLLLIVFWFLDALRESIVHKSGTFMDLLLFAIPLDSLIFRGTIIIAILVIGIIILRFIIKLECGENELLKLRKAVDTSGEVIFITEKDGVIIYINPEFTKVYGYSSEEIIKKTTPRILKSGVMKPDEYEAFWKVILNKEVVKGELINKTKDGTYLNIEGSANPILDEKGEIIGFLAIQRDITERKWAEEALRESEKTARAILNAPNNPAYLIDIKGILLSLNEAGAKLLGYDFEWLAGKSIFELFSIYFDDSRREKIEKVIDTGKKYRYEAAFEGKFYDITIYPLFNIKGEVNRLAIFDTDITEHKLALEQISLQNDFMHSVLESLPHPFYVIDINNYNVKLANSAAKLGNLSDMSKCYALTHNKSRPCSSSEHSCPIEEVKRTRQPVIIEHIHYNINDEPRNVEVHAYPIFGKDGSLTQMIEYSLDITERKKAEEEILKLNEELKKRINEK